MDKTHMTILAPAILATALSIPDLALAQRAKRAAVQPSKKAETARHGSQAGTTPRIRPGEVSGSPSAALRRQGKRENQPDLGAGRTRVTANTAQRRSHAADEARRTGAGRGPARTSSGRRTVAPARGQAPRVRRSDRASVERARRTPAPPSEREIVKAIYGVADTTPIDPSVQVLRDAGERPYGFRFSRSYENKREWGTRHESGLFLGRVFGQAVFLTRFYHRARLKPRGLYTAFRWFMGSARTPVKHRLKIGGISLPTFGWGARYAQQRPDFPAFHVSRFASRSW